jgi:hypothetical protein
MNHQARAFPAPATLEQAVQWTYACTIRHDFAGHDQIELEVILNAPEGCLSSGGNQNGRSAATHDLGRDETVCAFTVTPNFDARRRVYRTLSLAGRDGWASVGWPDIVCTTRDGTEHMLAAIDLAACELAGAANARCYAFPDDVRDFAAHTPLELLFRFGGVVLPRVQRATAAATVVRHESLIGPDGAATRAPLVHRSGTVRFPGSVEPCSGISARIPIGRWSYDPQSCPLRTVFDRMVDGLPMTLTCAISYTFPLSGTSVSEASLRTSLPVLQTGPFALSSGTVAALCQTLREWVEVNAPPAMGAEWAFSITSCSEAAQDKKRLILSLRNLVSPLDAPSP